MIDMTNPKYEKLGLKNSDYMKIDHYLLTETKYKIDYNILLTLMSINEKLDKLLSDTEETKEIPETKEEADEKKTGKICAHCGEVHARGVDYALCAKKKKE
jgi:hypothetical protein